MTEWTTIQTWPYKRFQQYGQMWRRWIPPDGSAPIEAAESAIIGCRASICYGASIAFGARINVEARIGDGASIGYRAIIGYRTNIGDRASVGNEASIGYWVSIGDEASIGNEASIRDKASIGDKASISDRANIGYQASIGCWASIGDGAIIGDRANIGDGASIGRGDIWRCIGPLGSGGRTLTVTSGANGIWCYTGCFAGPAEEFLAAVESKHGDSTLARGYKAALTFAEEQFRLDKEATDDE